MIISSSDFFVNEYSFRNVKEFEQDSEKSVT